jgi:hypothetical protein
MVRLISKKKVTARLSHQCDYCEGQILPGETYLRSVGFDEDRSRDHGHTWGAMVTDVRHMRCTAEELRRQ